METIGGVIVLIVIVAVIYKFGKSVGTGAVWDRDPSQQKLIELFIADATDADPVCAISLSLHIESSARGNGVAIFRRLSGLG
jgi:hypothetical protein